MLLNNSGFRKLKKLIIPAINPETESTNATKIIERKAITPFLLDLKKSDKPPSLSGNFSKTFVAVIPTVVAQKAPNTDVPIIIAGSLLPAAALTAIAVAGIKVKPAVLTARKVHMAFVAVPFSGFNLANSYIALSPNGVAAFPNPNIFAAIFIIIAPIAG